MGKTGVGEGGICGIKGNIKTLDTMRSDLLIIIFSVYGMGCMEEECALKEWVRAWLGLSSQSMYPYKGVIWYINAFSFRGMGD